MQQEVRRDSLCWHRPLCSASSPAATARSVSLLCRPRHAGRGLMLIALAQDGCRTGHHSTVKIVKEGRTEGKLVQFEALSVRESRPPLPRASGREKGCRGESSALAAQWAGGGPGPCAASCPSAGHVALDPLADLLRSGRHSTTTLFSSSGLGHVASCVQECRGFYFVYLALCIYTFLNGVVRYTLI